MKKFASRDLDKFVVRLPEGMRDKLAIAAKKNNRTMNAEMVSRLEQSLQGPSPLLVVHENTAAADILWEIKDQLDSLSREVRALQDRLPQPRLKKS